MRASYLTICAVCLNDIAPGDPIAKRHGEAIHADCYGDRDE